MFTKLQVFVCCCVTLLVPLESGRAADWLNAGPLFDEFPSTLSQGHRTEALGPLFYAEEDDGRKTWAVPPLLSHQRDPATDFTEVDFCFPVLTYDRFGKEYRWQLLQVLSFAGGQNQKEQGTRRFTLFPIYFQQRSVDPKQNYTAFFPLYGHLKNRLFRDEIFFILFPIYGQSRKKDVVTDNFIYPLFHVRHGESLHGWQFWPLVGHEHKEVTTHTNGFGDLEFLGGHDSWFWLWPIYSREISGLGTPSPRRQDSLLPFYSVLRSPQRSVKTVLWPLFNHITDRERKYVEWQTPWPIIEFARGEGKTTSRVWPFYSHAQNTNLESGFFLWPLYKYNRFHTDTVERERTRIALFFYSDAVQKNLQTGEAQRRIDMWPFFTYKRDYNGNSRLQIVSIIEPILPNSHAVERNYSPIESVWRSEKNPKTGASSQSLLWNLYRRETTAESKKCSLLFGLFQYQSGSEGKRLRLFYVPVFKTRPAAAAVSQ